ncbi:MAG: RHS repeat-associated core domain-containing protein [Lachnospiraceae bacterium]|nr:RHS repeat-associated core domain-containing protein [Lachnospiraceae bacterium]
MDDPEQQLLDRLTIQPIGDTFVEQETSVISGEDLWKLEMLEQLMASQQEVSFSNEYCYDRENKNLLVRFSSDGTIEKYVYGNGLIASYEAKPTDETTTTDYKTYIYDIRGSVTEVANVIGSVTAEYRYSTYGDRNIISGTETDELGYCARDGVLTEASGLLYMRARYYYPTLMRFINEDIVTGDISNSASLNRYAYVNGNPITLIDPFGLCAEKPIFNNIDIFGPSFQDIKSILAGFRLLNDIGVIESFKRRERMYDYIDEHLYNRLDEKTLRKISKVYNFTSEVYGRIGSTLDRASRVACNALKTNTLHMPPLGGIGGFGYNGYGNEFAINYNSTMSLALIYEPGIKAGQGLEALASYAGANIFSFAGDSLSGRADDLNKIADSKSKGGTSSSGDKLDKLLNSDYYKTDTGYDCSEIAEDFYNAAGEKGKIFRIEGKDGIINGYEYGRVYDYLYHEVYSDGTYIYDPRYRNAPVFKADYFRALKAINPSGFDVFPVR